MNPHLFVYGTLVRAARDAGMGGPERQRLWSESRLVSPATIRARLYDFGDYPGVALAEPHERDAIVHGEILQLRDDRATFSWLDRYEMIEPGQEATAEYARVITEAATPGSTSMVWVYVTRRDVSALTPIASGRWR
jgi:gamma-glutamylcyclotransferase (GGCT)/AIG2-like uncharacterized protein YtfP